MRYLRTVERPASNVLVKLVQARWSYDYARDPLTYTTSSIGRVTFKDGVLIVYARSGAHVLTRYKLLRHPGPTVSAPEREAYQLLREL